MSNSLLQRTQVVEDEVELSLADLCRACEADREVIVELVSYGLLDAEGTDPTDWRFAGSSLRRGRVALRLIRSLEVNVAGAAVAVELIEQIEALRGALAVSGSRRR